MYLLDAQSGSAHNGSVARSVPPWEANSYGLVSLLEIMRDYKLKELVVALGGIEAGLIQLDTMDMMSLKMSDDEYVSSLCTLLEGLRESCNAFDAEISLLDQITTLIDEIRKGTIDKREAVLYARVKPIIHGVHSNLSRRTFMYVPEDQALCWNNPHQFGEAFLLCFPPAAKRELIEAGNCFAASRYTACVFHCMRIAEYGLRKISRTLGVKVSDKGKPCRIEYATWITLIVAISVRIEQARKLSASPRKERRLQFYSEANDKCSYMKDLWRNEVSHTRKLYNRPEALGVMIRVKEFVVLLCEGVPK